MQLKILLLKAAALIASLIVGGCIQQPSPIVLPPHDGIVIDSHVTPQPKEPEGSNLTLTMDAGQFGTLAKWLGHDNQITLTKAVHVSQGGATLDSVAGTKLGYTMNDNSGLFTFAQPYPTVKAGFASKLIGGVSLHSVEIRGDGGGTAHTGVGAYGFRWDGQAGAEAVDLPIVFAYSQPGCPPCEAAKKAFADAVDLPFRVQWSDKAPAWVGSRPTFHWQASGDDWRKREQWDGVEKFVEMWKRSMEPKKAKVSASATTFVQPDRQSTSRQLAYHAGHRCDVCGRTVLVIAGQMQNGRHRHDCPCGNSWWH